MSHQLEAIASGVTESRALDDGSSISAVELLCGRCCRKTDEPVAKMCVCGTPLHPTCSDGVALRECALPYTFADTSTTGFCSRRCYEGDILARQSMPSQPIDDDNSATDNTTTTTSLPLPLAQQQQQLPQQPKRLAQHDVPNEITAVLTVKIGDASKTSRRHLAVSTFQFLLSEGFAVFQAKANSHTARELMHHVGIGVTESFVWDDRSIYIRPGVHSKQAELVELTNRNFDARIARSFRNFLKRKATPDGRASAFVCDVLTFVRKDTGRRRTGAMSNTIPTNGANLQPLLSAVKTTSRLHSLMELTEQQQQQHIVAGHGSDASASTAVSTMTSGVKRKFAQTQQRSSDASALYHASPSAATSSYFHLLEQSDLSSGGSSSGAVATTAAAPSPDLLSGYRSIRMVLNGAVVPVQVNVRDLLACFGGSCQ